MTRLLSMTLLLALIVSAPGCTRQKETTSTPSSAVPAPTSSTAMAPAVGESDGSSIETRHAAGPKVEPGQSMSLQDAYPDYKPGANDPEAESVTRGYRIVPVSDQTFQNGGAASMEDLVQLVATGIDLGDGPKLEGSAVDYLDFQDILWPEFPQSRPAAGVPVNESWDFLHRRHMASFNRTTGELHGKGLKVASIKVGKVVKYTNFKLHDDMQVTLVDAADNAIQFDMIRTVVECQGRFKLYSTRD